jgi:hypothetical protein
VIRDESRRCFTFCGEIKEKKEKGKEGEGEKKWHVIARFITT